MVSGFCMKNQIFLSFLLFTEKYFRFEKAAKLIVTIINISVKVMKIFKSYTILTLKL